MELNINQQKAIKAPENKVLVISGSGMGKTRVITERINYLLNEKKVPANKIVAISFTNMAAEEIRNRIPNAPKELFIGTLHSYAAKILREAGVSVYEHILQEDFDWLINRALKLPDDKIPEVEHFIIDEFQDLCQNEYNLAEKINSKNFFAASDPRQFIYGFKGASDDYVYSLYYDPTCTKYFLKYNYRTAPEILKFAEKQVARLKRSVPCTTVPMLKIKGQIHHTSFYDAVEDLCYEGDWNNWFILARTNDLVEYIMDKLESKGIPCTTFKQKDITHTQMEYLMKDNTVKVLTCHAAKGMESDKVIVVGARNYNEDELRLNYVAATRAKSVLYWCPAPSIRNKNTKKSYLRTGTRMKEW